MGRTYRLSVFSAAAKKIRAVRITLDPSDTYTVEFLGMQKFEVLTIAKHEGVYAG